MARGGTLYSEELWSAGTALRWLARDMRQGPLRDKLLALATDCEQEAAGLNGKFHRVRIAALTERLERGETRSGRRPGPHSRSSRSAS
jgi:hypothetical protein